MGHDDPLDAVCGPCITGLGPAPNPESSHEGDGAAVGRARRRRGRGAWGGAIPLVGQGGLAPLPGRQGAPLAATPVHRGRWAARCGLDDLPRGGPGPAAVAVADRRPLAVTLDTAGDVHDGELAPFVGHGEDSLEIDPGEGGGPAPAVDEDARQPFWWERSGGGAATPSSGRPAASSRGHAGQLAVTTPGVGVRRQRAGGHPTEERKVPLSCSVRTSPTSGTFRDSS
jgi:hypothetical protein